MKDLIVVSAGPLVVTPARDVQSDEAAFDRTLRAVREAGVRHGIREGERRAYWLVAIGALCAMEQAEHEEAVAGYATQAGDAAQMMVHGLWFTFITVMKALAASGDRDASRVLGERGW